MEIENGKKIESIAILNIRELGLISDLEPLNNKP
jgi:hypothetical protein